MKTKLLFILGIVLLLALTGCSKPVSEITSDDEYVGESVSVRGTVQGVTKIGGLSGYTIVDSNGDAIIVASEDLPTEGDTITVRGTLEKGILDIGYYINADN